MLIDLLYSGDDNVVLCAAGIPSNLTCNNAKNKASVVCKPLTVSVGTFVELKSSKLFS